jgi:2-polyprenyl-3-methyl-5-hydroxy-6-metoxy-1,4-benzoquinol methylase
MTKQEEIQEKYWDEYSKVLKQIDLDYPGQVEQEDFFKFMDLKPKSSILEIGAGIGRITIPLLKKGHYITATELSSKSLDIMKEIAAEENVSERLAQMHTNFEDVNIENKFDVVVFNAVIHHINCEKKNKILQNVYKALKPGGYLIALEPNPLNLLYYLLYFWRFIINKQGKNRWKIEKGMLYTSFWHIKKLLEKSGFSNLEYKHYAWFPSKAGNIHKSFLILNKILNKIPIIKEASAFIWYKAYKKAK